jgi:cytochrome c peroxidase
MGRWTQLLPTLGAAAMMGFTAVPAFGGTPAEQQQRFAAEARSADSGFNGFSAQQGRAFFNSTHGGDWSCASCHTRNPLAAGRHVKTGKTIAPLAPAANPERFTDTARVDKWLRRNCKDVLGRSCTAQEKGDVIEYLMSLR